MCHEQARGRAQPAKGKNWPLGEGQCQNITLRQTDKPHPSPRFLLLFFILIGRRHAFWPMTGSRSSPMHLHPVNAGVIWISPVALYGDLDELKGSGDLLQRKSTTRCATPEVEGARAASTPLSRSDRPLLQDQLLLWPRRQLL